jgi:hypothetical protein
MSKSTDVPATLLGFYYQLLLACKELVILLTANDAVTNYVAVEKGSDIRVAKKTDNTCIEVKFYKDEQFTRKHQSIRHTIYNFYNSFVDLQKNKKPLPQYIYRTNVMAADNDKMFFDQWNNKSMANPDEYIQYVKDCIVHEAVQIKPYSDAFNQFKDDNKSNIKRKKPTFADYYKLLINELHADPSKYKIYSEVVPSNNYVAFIRQVNYEFGDEHRSKSFILEKTRSEITQALQRYDGSLQESDCERIRNWVIEEFFDADRIESISVLALQEKVRNHKEIQVKYINDTILKKYIMAHDALIQAFSQDIDRYGFTSEKQSLLCCYTAFLEKFYSEAEDTSLEDLCSQYVLDAFEYQPYLIGDLFRSMSILATLSNLDSKGIALTNLNGINNFWLSEDHNYCLKGTDIRQIENDFKSLLNSFIGHVKRNGYIDKIAGTKKIVFRTDCKPCEINIDLEETIVDITQVYGNIKDQELFSSLDYKCSRCLDLKAGDTQKHVDCFIGGNCHARNTK